MECSGESSDKETKCNLTKVTQHVWKSKRYAENMEGDIE